MSIFIAEIEAGWAMKKWFWCLIIAVKLEVRWATEKVLAEVEVGWLMEICNSGSRSWISDEACLKFVLNIYEMLYGSDLGKCMPSKVH